MIIDGCIAFTPHLSTLDSIAIEADYSVHILRRAIFIVPLTEEPSTNLKLNTFTYRGTVFFQFHLSIVTSVGPPFSDLLDIVTTLRPPTPTPP